MNISRYYDSDLSIWFLSVDPIADKRSWVSPYSYCQNNPLNRVDPTGMLDTDFGMDKDGNVYQIGPTNNKPDRLFAINNKGIIDINKDSKIDDKDAITVNDKSFIPGLRKKYANGIYKSTTNSLSDAANVFKFASDNSDVEWSAVSQGNSSGTKYVVGSKHDPDRSPSPSSYGIESSQVKSFIHSHPGIENSEELRSMGDNHTQKPISGVSDWAYAINRYYNNNNKEPYPAYNYFPVSGNRYYVSPYGIKPTNSSIINLLKGVR